MCVEVTKKLDQPGRAFFYKFANSFKMHKIMPYTTLAPMPYTSTGPAMEKIFTPNPNTQPSAAVQLGHSAFENHLH